MLINLYGVAFLRRKLHSRKWAIFLKVFKIQTAKDLNRVSEEVITVVKLIHFAFPVAISYDLPVCIYIGNKK